MKFSSALKLNHIFRRLYSTRGFANGMLVLYARPNRLGVNRIPNIRQFAAAHDLIFFVSGKKSSNGKILFNECLRVNPNSHLIDDAAEIDFSLLKGVSSIGICGATSTPKWLMEQVEQAIQQEE